eukprot:PhF_6_TR5655/c0_g1_i1/m.8288
MDKSTTYGSWHALAVRYDTMTSSKEDEDFMKYVNSDDIQRRISNFRSLLNRSERGEEETRALMSLLRADFNRGSCGITSPKLYERLTRTLPIIEDYTAMVCNACERLASSRFLKSEEKYLFFTQACRAYGNTALMLHGGATLGMYHLGVVKGLLERNLLPRIISGTNTGAIVAALICTSADASRLFDRDSYDYKAFNARPTRGNVRRKFHRFLSEGYFMEVSVLVEFLRDNLGDVTFLEAYRRTGRVLNIVAKRESQCGAMVSWNMNYLTAPNVLVYSACAAACAMPGLYAPTDVLVKCPDRSIVPYHPCSLKVNTTPIGSEPSDRIRELFNVNCFIVSQASPVDIPALRLDLRTDWMIFRILRVFVEESCRFLGWLHSRGWLGKYGGSITRVLTTQLKSDVTIFPCRDLSDVLRCLSNPDKDLFDHCVWKGQLRVWPLVQRLKVQYEIERVMTEIVSTHLDQLCNQYEGGDYIPTSPRAYLF